MTAIGCPVSLDAVRSAVEGAAAIVAGVYAGTVRANLKPDGSPITAADVRANEFLHARLQDLLPAAWLSEESVDDPGRLAHDWAWIVDPLDGTKEFSRRIPEFAVSVGLVFRGTLVLGAVVNPATGEGGVGSVAEGQITCWGFGDAPAPAVTLDRAVASISRTEIADGSITPYLPLVPRAAGVGSVAYKLLRVAAGADDLTFSVQHKSEWDICGGAALVAAAGKVYRRFDGAPLRFNQADTRMRSGSAAGRDGLVDLLFAGLRERGYQGAR